MRSSHILGLNSRNHLYLSRFNRRSGKRIADSKLLTKKFLKRLELPHPRLIAAFTEVSDVKNFDWNSLGDNFVIKPAGGYAGEGIVLVRKRISRMTMDDRKMEDSSGRWKMEGRKPRSGKSIFNPLSSTTTLHHLSSTVSAVHNFQLLDGSTITLNDLRLHVLDILEGRFNRLNLQDTAIIEERVYKHPRFRRHAYQGTPDVRIIVFNKVPVMAALRLPTPESKGRANIHQGAIMVGIDLATGITTTASHWDKPIKTIDDRKWKIGVEGGKSKIEKSNLSSTIYSLPPSSILHHPSSNLKLNGIQIPEWDRMMELAVEVQEHISLGYMAVDFLIDPEKGPLIVELTARPGMGIQIANMAGLKRRIERVEGLDMDVTPASTRGGSLTRDGPGRGIEVAKALFAERFSDKIMAERGVKVVGVFETVKLRDMRGIKTEVSAKIDTGAFRSSIDRELAESLGLMKNRAVLWHDYYWSSLGREKRPVIPVTFWLAGRKIETTANVSDRSKMKEKLLIGRRDLGTFMVRPGEK